MTVLEVNMKQASPGSHPIPCFSSDALTQTGTIPLAKNKVMKLQKTKKIILPEMNINYGAGVFP